MARRGRAATAVQDRETRLVVTLCGEKVERWRIGIPGIVQLYRPLDDRCEGCHREGVEYLRDAVTGELRGPVCRVLAVARV